MTRCACCGGVLEQADALQQKVDQLLAVIEAAGLPMTFDGFIDEGSAAPLLNWSPFTMRNRRLQDQPIRFRKVGRRVEYAVTDLAKYLLDTETNFLP